MRIKIWQIVMDSEKAAALIFKDFRYLVKKTGQDKLDRDIYMQTFEGEADANDLEEVFVQFNADNRPNTRSMRSLSVSDAVEILGESEADNRLYYVDSVGFVRTEWQKPLVSEKEIEERIDLLLNDCLSQIYSRLNIRYGDIDPFQKLEWDEHCKALAKLFGTLINQNKSLSAAPLEQKITYPLSFDRLVELATLFKDGLLEDDEESAMEYFTGECHMTEDELEFFGIPDR